MMTRLSRLREKLVEGFLAVPVRIKIAGIMVLPVLILGLGLNYWVRTGLSDWLSYLLSNERVRIAMQAGSRSVLFVTLLAAVASVLLTFLMMLVLTRPLLELRKVAHKVAEGDLSSRAKIWTQDEIGEVAQAINVMIDRLVAGQHKLERSNRRLEAINRVAMVTARELELNEVLNASLRATLGVMGLKSGWIYLREATAAENSRFQLASSAGVEADLEHKLRDPSEGLCRCQQELLSGELGQKASVRQCLRLSRHLGAENVSHVTIPLETQERRFGVINLLTRDALRPSADDLELLSTIGAHVSEIVANAWLHATLVEKEAVRQALLEALVRAEEDERARLARELHDGAGARLTNLLVRLKALEKRAPTPALRQDIRDLCESTSETIERIRGISYRLRPAALEEFGLEVALRSLAQEMGSAAGVSVKCALEMQGRRLPFEVETTLYRIAQESLTNVVRHARARQVLVELKALPYAVCLRVEDDGVGFDPELLVKSENRRRLGLLSMQERAEMQGGSLEVLSAPGAGTSVQVRIPLEMEAQ